MKSYIIKMTSVVLILGTLICSYREKNKVVVNNYLQREIYVKSDVTTENLIVYEGLMLQELGRKIDTQFSSTLSGYGETFAIKALESEVDPIVAAAIVLLETGCKWNCSSLVNYCNNIGGMIGSGCNGYASFSSLEEGMDAFISNLSLNYYKQGLTTPELMNQKYATSESWYLKVNKYVELIKKS